jgi:two-component sensor histidine kinase
MLYITRKYSFTYFFDCVMVPVMEAGPTLAYLRPDSAPRANHYIANGLALLASVVRMQAMAIENGPHSLSNEQIHTGLEGLGARVEIVAQVHRRMAGGSGDDIVDLGQYLQEISSAIVSALSAVARIRLRFACEKDCMATPERALPVGLIVAELVTNAVKYAHPAGVAGKISVACEGTGDEDIAVKVSDDGIGLPERFDPMKDGNLGLRLVRSLASDLPARISFAHDALGTSVALQISKETDS